MRTTDGGGNWSPYAITPSGYNFSIQFISETTGWISGFDGTSVIIKTTDGGNNWFRQESPCKNEGGLSNILFINENIGWAIGNGIFKTTNGGSVVSVEDEKKFQNNFLPAQITLFQNYPNPFNPATSMQYAIGSKQIVTLKVYDILGREVVTLVNEEQNAGMHKVKFDAAKYKLSSGVYFYRIQADQFSETKKMILMR